MSGESFTCSGCGKTFTSEWTNEDAEAEYRKNFADDAERGEETDVVCDDCYRSILNWAGR